MRDKLIGAAFGIMLSTVIVLFAFLAYEAGKASVTDSRTCEVSK